MKQNKIYSYPEMEKQLQQWRKHYSSDIYQLESLGLTYGKVTYMLAILVPPMPKTDLR